MSEIPFIILAFVSAIALILPLMAYVFRTAFPPSFIMWLGGIIWLLIFLTTDNITLGYTDERDINTNSIITEVINNFTASFMDTIGEGTTDHQLGATRILSGERLSASSSLMGDNFNMLEFDLQRVGSPTGTLYAGVWATSIAPTDANYLCLIGTYDVATIPTSRTTIEIERTDGLLCSATTDNIIGIFYDDGSVGNLVALYRSTTGEGDLFDGTRTFLGSYNSGAFASSTNLDYSMAVNVVFNTTSAIIEDNDFETVGNNPINYEIRNPETFEPTLIGILFMMLALAYIMVGVLAERG